MYKIPLFDLNFNSKEQNAVVRTLKSKWISVGPACNKFENLFNQKIGIKHSLSTASCTASLHMALVALDIKKNDEVIVPSLTFAATVNAVKYVGAKPVFCDIISQNDLTVNPNDIKNKISSKTKAIIIMHYAGFPCKMNAIMKIAKNNNLFVVEDAAHAPLSEYNGKKLGTFGDISTFSFFSNKNISTGEGGMVSTNDNAIYNKLKLMRSHGMTTLSYQRSKGHATSYDIESLGYNYRMDDIRASIGIAQLEKIDKDLVERQKNRELYLLKLGNNPKIILPFKRNTNFVSNYIFPIVLRNSNYEYRDFVRDSLHKKGIQTSVHYPPVHRFSIYRKKTNQLPITDYVSSNTITLPMYAKLKTSEIKFICNSLEEIIQK